MMKLKKSAQERFIILCIIFSIEGVFACTENFLSLESHDEYTKLYNRQLIYPHMRFTCTAYITKWTFIADFNSLSEEASFPELQLWDAINGGYRLITSSGYDKAQTTINLNETGQISYTPHTPIPVHEGYILGVLIRFFSSNSVRIHFLETPNGIYNYYFLLISNTDNQNTTLFTSTAYLGRTYIPFVTAELSFASSTNIITITSNPLSTASSTVLQTSTNIPSLTSSTVLQTSTNIHSLTTSSTVLQTSTNIPSLTSSTVLQTFTNIHSLTISSTALETSTNSPTPSTDVLSSFIATMGNTNTLSQTNTYIKIPTSNVGAQLFSLSTSVSSIEDVQATQNNTIHTVTQNERSSSTNKDSTSQTESTSSLFVTPNHANASESNEIMISSPWVVAVMVIGGFFIISSLIFVITVGILIGKLRNKSVQDHTSLTITNIPKVTNSLYIEHQSRPEHDSMYLNTAYIHYKDIEHRWKPRPEHIGDSMCTNAEYMGYNNEGIYDTLQPMEHHYDSPIVNNYFNSEIHTVSNEFVLNPAYKNESFLERTYSNPIEIAPGVIPMQINMAYKGYTC